MPSNNRIKLEEYSPEFLNHYLPENYQKENTRRQYRYAVIEFIQYCEQRSWTFGFTQEKIHNDTERIRKFYGETNLTNPKTNGIRRFIEYIGKQLTSERQLACEQISDLVSYKRVTDRKERTKLSAQEIKEYLLTQEQIQKALDESSYRQKVIIKTLLDTGMRIGELSAVKVEDIDLDREDIGGAIQVNKTYISGDGVQQMPKSADGRRAVELRDDTAQMLESYIEINEIEGRVFTGVSNLRKKFNEPFVKAGIKTFEDEKGRTKTEVSPHWTRHIFITWQTRQGTDIDDLMKVTGHSSRETLKEYQHLSEYDVVGIYS